MRTKGILFGGLVFPAVLVLVGQAYLFGGGEKKKAPEKKPNIAESKIVNVTVYPNNALVTREVTVPAGKGATEIVVSPLPVRVVDSSLYSEGNENLRILSTRFRTRQVKEDTREDVRKVQQQIKDLQMESRQITSQMDSLQKNLQMLSKLENFTTVTTVHSTEKGGLNADTAIKMAKYVMEERVAKNKELVQLKEKQQENQEQVNFLQRKLQEISAGSNKIERDAVIVVDRVMGKGGTLRLNYLVDSVSWTPQYKLRAGKENEGVELDYLASLTQQSGENWENVGMTLSTAQPTLNAVPPELQKLEVTVVARTSIPGMPPGVPGEMGQVPNFRPQKAKQLYDQAKKLRMDAQRYEAQLDLTKNFDALNAAAAQEQTQEHMQFQDEDLKEIQKFLAKTRLTDGPSVTFHLPHKLTIPSRYDEQVVEVTKINLAPKYYYKSIPILNNHVYHLADLVNKSDYILLPGEGTMYQGSDFVGRMRLPLVAIGEKFTVGFGVDPQLQIRRELVKKSQDAKQGNQVLTYQYRIFINSYKKKPVQMQVWDRMPKGKNDSINVTLEKSDPELSDDPLYLREERTRNLLRWDLKVDPMMHGEKALAINYTFKIELARQMVINQISAKK